MAMRQELVAGEHFGCKSKTSSNAIFMLLNGAARRSLKIKVTRGAWCGGGGVARVEFHRCQKIEPSVDSGISGVWTEFCLIWDTRPLIEPPSGMLSFIDLMCTVQILKPIWHRKRCIRLGLL